MIKFTYLLYWLGIHKYKVIDTIFGFGAAGSIQKIKCKTCGIQKFRDQINGKKSEILTHNTIDNIQAIQMNVEN